MRRGTTPTITCTVDYDFSTCEKVRLSVKSGCVRVDIDKANLAITATSIVATLTQEQTLSLTGVTASLQVRGVTADGIAVATDIKTLPIDAILDGEVL